VAWLREFVGSRREELIRAAAARRPLTCGFVECPRQDSNLRSRLRRARRARLMALAGDGSVDFTLIRPLVTAVDAGWKRTGCVPNVYPLTSASADKWLLLELHGREFGA
jgi:hypothetical protein